jgi:hypothetical protein
MTSYFIPPNQQARHLRAFGPYAHVAPGSSVIAIPINNGIEAPPNNRQIMGKLFVGQRLDVMVTSGWAAQYNLSGMVGSAGQLSDFYLSDPVGVISKGVGPTVTVAVSGGGFAFTFANPNVGGNITGFFELEYWWIS